MSIPSFETTFAVPLSCESCVKDVSDSLYKLDGISKVTADLESQLIAIEGTAAPSSIVAAIQDTGRDAILRGSGETNSACVCILEDHGDTQNPVKGLIRMVQVGPETTIIDTTIKGLKAGTYEITVREFGNIDKFPTRLGGVFGQESGELVSEAQGYWGLVEVDNDTTGSVYLTTSMTVETLVGKGITVCVQGQKVEEVEDYTAAPEDTKKDILVGGVVGSSAGVWDNDKTVCSCSGKTVWEEREEQVGKGML